MSKSIYEIKSEGVFSKEEIFGPVFVFMKFKDEKKMVEAANNSEYGLTSSVFS